MDNPDELKELFSAFGPVTVRRMFGGAGIWAEGIMFALVSDGEIFLKADEVTIPTLKAEGSKPFSYEVARGKQVSLSYWRLPERLLDDPEELASFARAALAAAHRAAAKKERTRQQPRKRVKPPAIRIHRRARSRR